jgi:hypothetical protein
MRHVPRWALRILDSRLLSRVRALVFLGTVGVGAVVAVILALDGLLLALVKGLTHVGVVPLVFIGLGLFVGLSMLLAAVVARARGWLAQRSARAAADRSSATPQAALASSDSGAEPNAANSPARQVVDVTLGATEPEVPDEELSKLGAEFQKWWDKVTRMLRQQGFDPWTEYESTPEFKEAYLELRNEGLAFVDRGIDLGVWDYDLRERFYDLTPLGLWELNRYIANNFTKKWRAGDA